MKQKIDKELGAGWFFFSLFGVMGGCGSLDHQMQYVVIISSISSIKSIPAGLYDDR